jgi:hypothetical protein
VAFNENNELVGLPVAVRIGSIEVGLIASVEAIKSFLDNRQERIEGKICYDYVRGGKIDGECVCKDGFEQNEESNMCEKKEDEPADDTEAEDESVVEADEPSEAETAVEVSIEPTTDAVVNDGLIPETDESTAEDAFYLHTSLRDVIITGVIECKQESGDDKPALRACLKETIKDFIKERSKVKRTYQKQCRAEGWVDMKACFEQKVPKDK